MKLETMLDEIKTRDTIAPSTVEFQMPPPAAPPEMGRRDTAAMVDAMIADLDFEDTPLSSKESSPRHRASKDVERPKKT